MENNKETTTKGEKTMKGKYLSPKADLTFKLVFGEHKDLTMSLLNALLPLAENAPIVSIEYDTPEMVPETKGKKNSIVDVRCKDAKGRHFIVEMQMQWSDVFRKRIVVNAAKAIIKQVGSGEDYSLVQPVFSLNLVNERIPSEKPDEFYHDYAILNVDHPERSMDYLRFVFVELPKVASKREQNDARISSVEREQARPQVKFQPRNIMEKKMAVLWLRFLTEIDENTDQVPAELLENEETRKALSIIEKSAMTEGQLYAYEKFWDAIVTEKVLAKDNYERGKSDTNLETAKKMKADNMPSDLIAKYTGLSIDDIEAL